MGAVLGRRRGGAAAAHGPRDRARLVDRYEEFAARSGESGIDREFLNVELLEGMLRSLGRPPSGGPHGGRPLLG